MALTEKSNGALPAAQHRPDIGIVVASAADFASPRPWRKNLLTRAEDGVRAAGGVPHTLVLAGWGKSAGETSYYPMRSLLADSVDAFVRGGAPLKGLVLLADDNAAAAGLLLGAARVDVPALLLPLWSDAKKSYAGRTVLCLAEVLGLAPLGSSIWSEGAPEPAAAAFEAGGKVVEWGRKRWSIRSGLLPTALSNAFRFDAICGGSVEAYLFLSALAQEGHVNLNKEDWFRAAPDLPQVCHWDGRAGRSTADIQEAGGMAGIAALLPKIWLPQASIDGKSVASLAKSLKVKPSSAFVKSSQRVIGGVRLLKGNLAQSGALCLLGPAAQKSAGFSGPCAVFNNAEDAQSALIQKLVRKGDVLVVRYEGPRGGRGLRPLGALLAEPVKKQGLAGSIAVITDGIWGDADRPAWVVELVSPDASSGSPLSVLRNGDRIDADTTSGRLLAHLTETDLNVRMTRWKPEAVAQPAGFGARYARQASNAMDGAILKSN